jgi:glycosyltransferase 2 family protein
MSLGLYCLGQLVSSYRWQLLARTLGFQDRFGRFVALYYVGMFFNLFLPTSIGGDVVRAWSLGKKQATSEPRTKAALLSVISERFSGLLALLLLAGVTAFVGAEGLPSWAFTTVWGLVAAGGLGLIMLPVVARWHSKLRALAQGLSLYRGHRRTWLIAFGLSLIVQVAAVAEVWLLGSALHLPASFAVYAIAVPLTTLLTMLPITVNGVGVREGALAVLLAPAGVTSAGALALGALWFVVLLAASLLGGIVYLLAGFSSPSDALADNEGTHNGPVDHHSRQGRARQPRAAA